MSDPSYALQVANYAALIGDAALTALVPSDEIFDQVKQGTNFPYVNLGESQVLDDDDENCADGSEVFVRTHIWTRNTGFDEAKRIAAEVRRILKVAPVLSGFTVTLVQFVQTQFLRDPDGQSQHAIVEHRYLISHSG